MSIHTPFTKQIGLEHPIVQAPMGGANATPPELVSAVCEAGGLGFIGAAYMTPDQIERTAREVRARTRRPFGINLFAPLPRPAGALDAGRAIETLRALHDELQIAPPTPPASLGPDFSAQFEAVLASGARVFSFTFGLVDRSVIEAAKARGMCVIGTATVVDEARTLAAAGVDAVVAQGSEAGAHRGTFGAPFEAALVGTMALVPQIVDAVRVPVLASGGIMDGRGVAAALALGASAVQMGTAFLTTDECGIAPVYKEAILAAGAHDTRITRAFSGRPARGIVNRAMEAIEMHDGAILPYPVQNALTRPMRNEAAKRGRPEFLSLWAGQGAPLARRESATALVARVAREAEDAVRAVSGAIA